MSRRGSVARGAKAKVRVPNPAKQPKGRLDAPPERVHPNRKRYRRRRKYPSRDEE